MPNSEGRRSKCLRLASLGWALIELACASPARSQAPSPAGQAPPPSYRLPFEAGKAYLCTQSRNGVTSHQGSVVNAVDFSMPEGAAVCAARDGRVAAVKSDSGAGGPSPAFVLQTNYIHVDHGDGTLGRYLHLRKEGALVKVGDAVYQGDPIGYAGNTGFTTGPHLHFDVWRGGTTIPFVFDDVETDGGVPQTGKAYVSKNVPGISADLKTLLAESFRLAELFDRSGAFHLAYPRYRQVVAQKLKIDYEPQRIARERLQAIEAQTGKLAEEADALVREGKAAEALERIALAREAYNGVPGAQTLHQKYTELARDAGARKALEALRDRLKAQELFFAGLRSEGDNRPDAAAHCYGQILKEYPATPHAEAARPRMQEVEGKAAALKVARPATPHQ